MREEKKIRRDRQKNWTTPLFSSPPFLHPSHSLLSAMMMCNHPVLRASGLTLDDVH